MTTEAVFVLFDGPPEAVAGRFIDVVDASGRGVGVGTWHERENGTWALKLRVPSRSVRRAGKNK